MEGFCVGPLRIGVADEAVEGTIEGLDDDTLVGTRVGLNEAETVGAPVGIDDGIVGCSVALGDFEVETKVGVILDGCWDASATGTEVGSDDTDDGLKLGLPIGESVSPTCDGDNEGIKVGILDGADVKAAIGLLLLGVLLGEVSMA